MQVFLGRVVINYLLILNYIFQLLYTEMSKQSVITMKFSMHILNVLKTNDSSLRSLLTIISKSCPMCWDSAEQVRAKLCLLYLKADLLMVFRFCLFGLFAEEFLIIRLLLSNFPGKWRRHSMLLWDGFIEILYKDTTHIEINR